MWQIFESKSLLKICKKIPLQVLKKYELWKDIIVCHGPEKLRVFPGFHDEELKGDRKGQRSSRLNIQYRVIYTYDQDSVAVYVLEINPHAY